MATDLPKLPLSKYKRTKIIATLTPGRPAGSAKINKLVIGKNSVLHSGDVVVTVSGRRRGVIGTTDTIKVRVLE